MNFRLSQGVGWFGGGLTVLVAAIFSMGCGARSPEPQVASSASQLAYAHDYPADLARVRQEAETQLQLSEGVAEALARFPDALPGVDAQFVGDMYRGADEEGRAEAYVRAYEESALVSRFFVQEKRALTSQVAGAAQRAAKKESCDVELYGATSFSLEKAVSKRLEERTRSRSEVHAQVEAAREELGSKNADTLHAQVEQISAASYVVNIRSVRARQDLESLYQQSSDIRETLTGHRDAQSARAGADKKAVQQTAAALAKLEQAVAQTAQTLELLEDQERAARDAYVKALDSLLDGLQQRAESVAETKAKE